MRERRPEDFQVVCRVKYAGDIKLSLSAEILLDYPMPSFVGLPLKLNVTGLAFEGVAVVAYIRKRVHFCFLSAEDADTLVGSVDHRQQQQQDQEQQTMHRTEVRTDNGQTPHFCLDEDGRGGAMGPTTHTYLPDPSSSSFQRQQRQNQQHQKRFGDLLQEIRVESEIGRKECGKQVLKNVGKVERFVLAQVRRIFQEELVYPSFWTFLI